MNINKFIAAIVCVASLIAGFATVTRAQEAGLYDAPPPEGTSYVRFLNRSKLLAPVVKLSGIPFSQTETVLSSYSYVKEGTYEIEFNTEKLSAAIIAGRFYTVVVGDAAGALKPIAILEDRGLANASSNSGLYFYNYASESVDLQVNVNGKSGAVFKAVEPGGAEFKEVKPFDVAFDLVIAGKIVASIPQKSFVRGSGISIVVTKLENTTFAEAIDNKVSK